MSQRRGGSVSENVDQFTGEVKMEIWNNEPLSEACKKKIDSVDTWTGDIEEVEDIQELKQLREKYSKYLNNPGVVEVSRVCAEEI